MRGCLGRLGVEIIDQGDVLQGWFVTSTLQCPRKEGESKGGGRGTGMDREWCGALISIRKGGGRGQAVVWGWP